MDLHKLEYIVAIAEYENITKAAENLHVSQPTLSTYLALLEKDLGVVLFTREKKSLHITSAGAKYVQACKEILSIKESLYADIYNERNIVLRVGMQLSNLQIFSLAIQHFKQCYPDITINPKLLNSKDAYQQVLKNELDFAYAVGIPNYPEQAYPGVLASVIARWDLKLLLCRNNPVFWQLNMENNCYHKEDSEIISRLPVCYIKQQAQQLDEDIFPALKIVPDQKIEIAKEASQFLLTYVLINNGYTICPYSNISKDFVQLDLPEAFSVYKMMLYKKDHHLTKYEEAFNEMVQQEFRKHPYYYDFSYMDS